MIIDIRGRFYYKLDTKVNGRWLHIILYIKGTSDQFVNLQNIVKFPSVGNFSTARISATNISTTDNLPKGLHTSCSCECQNNLKIYGYHGNH